MKKHLLFAAVASLALTPAAFAQSPAMEPLIERSKEAQKSQTETQAPSQGQSQAQLAPGDQEFVTQAAIGNRFEVETSELAEDNASSPDVKAFAAQMVRDHGQASRELEDAADSLDADVPNRLDTRHAELLDQLEGLQGPEFDMAYIDAQRQAHQEAVALFSDYSRSGGALSDWAAQKLPVLRGHQQHLQQVGGIAALPGDVESGRASTPDAAPMPAPRNPNMGSY